MSRQPFTIRIVIAAIAVIGIAVLAWFLWQIRSIILLLAIGILFGAIIEPTINRLRRIGLSRGQALLALYLVIFGTIGLAIYFVWPLLVRQIVAFDRSLPDIFDSLHMQARESPYRFVRENVYTMLLESESAYNNFRKNPGLQSDQAFSLANTVFKASLSFISMLIVTFYWTVEKVSIKRWVLGLFGFNHRARAHAIWDEIEYRIGGWARGQLLLMLCIGLIFGAIYYALDLRFWLALAIIAGLTEVIPYIGPIIAGSAAALVALSASPEKALIVIILTFLVQQLEGAFLVPRIMKNSVGLTPLTIILAVLVGNVLGGPAGSIIAIPIGAACQVIVSSLLRSRDDFIASELRTMDVQPLSPNYFDSPFVEPNKSRFIPLPASGRPRRVGN